ncbi:hypothetical protein ABXS75_06790 [Roseburia hominis]
MRDYCVQVDDSKDGSVPGLGNGGIGDRAWWHRYGTVPFSLA